MGVGAGTSAVFFPASSTTITAGDPVAGGFFTEFREGRWFVGGIGGDWNSEPPSPP